MLLLQTFLKHIINATRLASFLRFCVTPPTPPPDLAGWRKEGDLRPFGWWVLITGHLRVEAGAAPPPQGLPGAAHPSMPTPEAPHSTRTLSSQGDGAVHPRRDQPPPLSATRVRTTSTCRLTRGRFRGHIRKRVPGRAQPRRHSQARRHRHGRCVHHLGPQDVLAAKSLGFAGDRADRGTGLRPRRRSSLVE